MIVIGVGTCFCLWGQTAYMANGRHDYYTSVHIEPALSVEYSLLRAHAQGVCSCAVVLTKIARSRDVDI